MGLFSNTQMIISLRLEVGDIKTCDHLDSRLNTSLHTSTPFCLLGISAKQLRKEYLTSKKYY